MRGGLGLVIVAACGRVDFDPIAHRVLYAATRAPDQLAAFSIAGDGSLAPLAPVAAPTLEPTAVAVDPQHAFAFVAGLGPPALATFALDSNTGAPTEIATFDDAQYTTIQSGFSGVTVEPTGRFVYTGDSQDNNFALALDRATGQGSIG